MTEQALQIIAEAPARFTAADYCKLVGTGAFHKLAGGGGVELDHGVIVRMNSVYVPHRAIQSELVFALKLMTIEMPLTVIFEPSVELSEDTVREPDVAVTRKLTGKEDFVDGAVVLLAIEVGNDSLRYDLTRKAVDYAMAGIADYWVFDVEGRCVHLHTEPGPSGYAQIEILPFGAPLTAACLPGPLTLAL